MNFELFEPFITRISVRLTNDRHLREDLSQEMRLEFWQLSDATETVDAMRHAFNVARRYARRHNFRHACR